MTRRIGSSVIRAVEWLESNGPSCVSAGRPRTGEISPSLDTKALRRAVQYGLATRTAGKPYVYRSAQDWRAVLNPMRLECGRVSSVWDLASTN